MTSNTTNSDILTAEALREAMKNISASTSAVGPYAGTSLPNYVIRDAPSTVDDRLRTEQSTGGTYWIGDKLNDYDHYKINDWHYKTNQEYRYNEIQEELEREIYRKMVQQTTPVKTPAPVEEPTVRDDICDSDEVSGPLAELINGL